MKFLFLLFVIFLLFVFAFGFSVLRLIFRLFLGGGSTKNMGRRQTTSNEQRNTTNYSNTRNSPSKIFPRDEGEYIDYEEVR